MRACVRACVRVFVYASEQVINQKYYEDTYEDGDNNLANKNNFTTIWPTLILT